MSESHHCCHCSGEKSDQPTIKPTKEWFCPMCPGVESDKPGACPKCGMALERNPSYRPAAIYTCPMHPEIQQDHPGACPLCGMALELVASAAPEEDRELRDMQRRFMIGAALTIPVVILAMGAHFPGISSIPAQISAWIQAVLSTPVVLWVGWPFLVRGMQSWRSGHLNMFTLISLGTSVAYFFSLVAILAPGLLPHALTHDGMLPVYFEAAAAITVLVLLGQILELKARASTGAAIRALLDLSPATARRIHDGVEEEIPLSQVQKGDLLRVRPGEKVPVDGALTEGRSDIDESMISGESLPVSKAETDKVIGGTLNGAGSFIMKAEHIGAETVLSQIVDMVSQAQRSRAPIQRLADRIAGWFVPAVLAAAGITFIIWSIWGPAPALTFALVNAVSVLIIACPCALGLATPMSIMVGVGRGAGLGILIKDAEVLETLGKVEVLVVDKTGTLTEGRPSVVEIRTTEGFSEQDVLGMAAALETQSEHPLASAVVRTARERLRDIPSATQFTSLTGQGVKALVEGQNLLLGKGRLLEDHHITLPTDLSHQASALQSQGHTVIWLGINGKAAGILALADPIKTTTAAAMESLHSLGIKVVMLTGDNPQTAERVASTLGIDEVHAEVSPRTKQDHIARLKKEGAVVAMAGDGINDAPALAAADVGIAMGTGTDVAMQSSGVTLLKGDLRSIAIAVRLSRATMQNIRQNLAFAFLYNGIGIPIAAGVLYPAFGLLLSPVIASAAMALSSVSVIGNALRLRRAKLDAAVE